MPNFRLEVLRFIHERPLAFSSFCTFILCAVSSFGFALEYGDSHRCRPDLYVWLVVVVVRSLLRLICVLLRGYVQHHLANTRTGASNHWFNLRYFSTKTIEVLDMMGLIWFTVGNVIFFIASASCATLTPLIFSACAIYIGGWYLGIMLPLWLQFSLRIIPPRDEQDRQYLLRLISGMAPNLNRGANLSNEHLYGRDSSSSNPESLAQQEAFWKQWLKLHGCEEFEYHGQGTFDDQNEKQMQMHRGCSSSSCCTLEEGAEMQCAICLMNFTGNASEAEAAEKMVIQTAAKTAEEGPKQPLNESHGIEMPPLPEMRPERDLESGAYDIAPTDAADDDHRHDGGGGGSGGCNAGEERPSAPIATTSSADEAADSAAAATVSPSAGRDAGEEDAAAVSNLVVRYPCASGQHYFHTSCIIQWLQVKLDAANSMRNAVLPRHRVHQYTHNVVPASLAVLRSYPWFQEESLTCPCCREMPQRKASTGTAESRS